MEPIHDVLFVHCKDTNLKAIHNTVDLEFLRRMLFVHCKDTNLKAIHNALTLLSEEMLVVRALQRY